MKNRQKWWKESQEVTKVVYRFLNPLYVEESSVCPSVYPYFTRDFEVHKMVTIKATVFWYMTPCSLVGGIVSKEIIRYIRNAGTLLPHPRIPVPSYFQYRYVPYCALRAFTWYVAVVWLAVRSRFVWTRSCNRLWAPRPVILRFILFSSVLRDIIGYCNVLEHQDFLILSHLIVDSKPEETTWEA